MSSAMNEQPPESRIDGTVQALIGMVVGAAMVLALFWLMTQWLGDIDASFLLFIALFLMAPLVVEVIKLLTLPALTLLRIIMGQRASEEGDHTFSGRYGPFWFGSAVGGVLTIVWTMSR